MARRRRGCSDRYGSDDVGAAASAAGLCDMLRVKGNDESFAAVAFLPRNGVGVKQLAHHSLREDVRHDGPPVYARKPVPKNGQHRSNLADSSEDAGASQVLVLAASKLGSSTEASGHDARRIGQVSAVVAEAHASLLHEHEGEFDPCSARGDLFASVFPGQRPAGGGDPSKQDKPQQMLWSM